MSDARKEYGDIIDKPHHQSKSHRQMSMSDRAAQFAPFAALRGYDEEVAETARTTDQRQELSNEDIALLNERLHIIIDNIHTKPDVIATYFVPDEKKSGGAYEAKRGKVRRIDEVERLIYFVDNTKISIDNLHQIDGDLFE